MNSSLFLQGFLDYQNGRALSPKTITRCRCLTNKFLSWLADTDIRDVTIDTIKAYRKHLETTNSRRTGKPVTAVTIKLELSTLKSFFEYLYLNELILHNPLEGLKFIVTNRQGIRPVFSESDISHFLDSISILSSSGIRDRHSLN